MTKCHAGKKAAALCLRSRTEGNFLQSGNTTLLKARGLEFNSAVLPRSLYLSCACCVISRCVADREAEKPEVSSQVSHPQTGQPHSQQRVWPPEAAAVHTLL